MPKRRAPVGFVLGGAAVMAIGYMHPTLIGQGSRPYAYISVIALGAMLAIVGALLWRDS